MRKRVNTAVLLYVILFVALVVMSVWAAENRMGSTEQSVFSWIYNMPDGLRIPALLISQLGSAWLFLGVLGLLLIMKWRPESALLTLRNGVFAYGATFLIKLMVGRGRPVYLLEELAQRETPILHLGFPSSHAALVTAIGLTAWPYVPKRWRWVIVSLIILVSWSRVYLGVHAPLDVLGGMIVGLLVVKTAEHLPKVTVTRGVKS